MDCFKLVQKRRDIEIESNGVDELDCSFLFRVFLAMNWGRLNEKYSVFLFRLEN